jgi:hypothetical protein
MCMGWWQWQQDAGDDGGDRACGDGDDGCHRSTGRPGKARTRTDGRDTSKNQNQSSMQGSYLLTILGAPLYSFYLHHHQKKEDAGQ